MKKKVLALFLCCALVIGLIPATLSVASSADTTLSVYSGDTAVTNVTLPRNGNTSLRAVTETGTGSYQWQVHVSEDTWANIVGATGSALNLTYGMVANLTIREIRCRLTNGVNNVTYSNPVTVEVVEAQEAAVQNAAKQSLAPGTVLSQAQPVGDPVIVPGPALMAAPAETPVAEAAPEGEPVSNEAEADEAVTNDAPAANDAPANDTPPETTTYSIVINYVFTDGTQAANPWTATIGAGTSYQQTVNSPVVVGYTPNQTSVTVDVKNASQDTTYTVTYSPAQVNYTVNHYKQNVNDDKYTLAETEEKTGYTESAVGEGLAKSYEGFYSLLYDTTTEIAADGSTVIDVYYDRYYYLMSFDLDGGYGVEPIYARYGAKIEVGTPTKAGYSFGGWSPVIPDTMPAENKIYAAQWGASNAKYVVQYWQENANDDDYSFVEQVTRTATAGSVVSGSNDKNYSGFTFNSDKTDTNVTVNGDNSTVVNVYYKRNVYQVKFYSKDGWLDGWTEDTNKRITAKYGAYIGDKWPGGGWYVGQGSSTAQSNLATMPLGGKNFYGKQHGHNTSTAYYYVEILPGETGDVKVQGKDYKLHHTDTVSHGYASLTVTDEERYNIEGFTCNTSISTKNGNSYNGAKFYYTRNSYDLVFDDQYGKQVSEKLPFEQVLSESVNHKNNYVPTYPSTLEAGAYTFGGWYTDPGCTHPVDWNAKMPAAKVILYAKWAPKTHTVKTYLTKEVMDGNGDPLNTWENVPHRSTITNPPEEPERDPYTFVGWFYMENGVEKAFDMSMPVIQDLNLYAKWRSDALVTYTIHYQLADGTTIADDTTGSALAGSTKTFDAKTGAQLNEGYRSGYFPTTSSHSLTFNIEGGNEFTFIYVPKDEVNYTVRYLEKDTNVVLYPEKKGSTSNAVITEKFEQITDYAPDAYQKRLVLSADDSQNIITFWYTKDEVHAPVQIIHWTQNIAGDDYTEYQSSTNLNGVIDQNYSENPLTIPGFTYNETESNPSGTLTAAGLVLNLYYDRIEYPYEFRFLEQGTNAKLAEPETGNARFGAQVTQTAKTIPGYKLVSANNQAITIAIEDPANVANKNVKIFYYVEETVDIKYQVVGPTGSGTLSSYQDNNVGVIKGTVNGSTPTAASGFKFVGWFKDPECTQQVDPTWVDTNSKLTPGKTKNYGTTEKPIMAYEAATYYAKFEYDVADLTITKTGCQDIDENQSFIFSVTGEGFSTKVVIQGNNSVTIKGLKIGEYTVTEVTSWSWRYTPQNGTQTITLQPDGSTVIFNNSREKTKWLGGDAYSKNIFKAEQ